jgi:hypothetical protein
VTSPRESAGPRRETQAAKQTRYWRDLVDRERKWALRYGHMNGLAEAARDVCMYCGGRAPGWLAAEGPNVAGNWTHSKGPITGGVGPTVLCAASSIRARLAWLMAQGKPCDACGKGGNVSHVDCGPPLPPAAPTRREP